MTVYDVLDDLASAMTERDPARRSPTSRATTFELAWPSPRIPNGGSSPFLREPLFVIDLVGPPGFEPDPHYTSTDHMVPSR
jgi:hypothetical protein